MEFACAFVFGALVGAAVCLMLTDKPPEKFKPCEFLEFTGAIKAWNKDEDHLLITSTGRAFRMETWFDPLEFNKDLFTCDDRVYFMIDSRIERVLVFGHRKGAKHVQWNFYFRGAHPVFQNLVVCGCGHVEADCHTFNMKPETEAAVLEKLHAAGIEVWALDEKTKARHPTYAWKGLWSDQKKDQ